ncbi:hypothetical protein [Algoriphagus sp.]|jgi:uncharacterized membrane protein|uniref:hypothetical protein n=1 Tax=Algoriphagus sp. TaxID=1872435 RepID=UPI0027270582|nr:hypothetical protein [Algoriphagus sp.]MDO8965385.1 hypothetical protein [Algoriphagus sp.]MDP3198817.1 hypothetical protein [Algoriphagus sp.]
MKKIAQYLQIVVLAYFILYLIFFISFGVFGSMFGMDPLTSDSMVKVFLVGLILFLAAWGAGLMHNSNQNATFKKMQDEMNGLKAKLYDFEHPQTLQQPKPLPQKPHEETSGILRPRQNFTDQ